MSGTWRFGAFAFAALSLLSAPCFATLTTELEAVANRNEYWAGKKDRAGIAYTIFSFANYLEPSDAEEGKPLRDFLGTGGSKDEMTFRLDLIKRAYSDKIAHVEVATWEFDYFNRKVFKLSNPIVRLHFRDRSSLNFRNISAQTIDKLQAVARSGRVLVRARIEGDRELDSKTGKIIDTEDYSKSTQIVDKSDLLFDLAGNSMLLVRGVGGVEEYDTEVVIVGDELPAENVENKPNVESKQSETKAETSSAKQESKAASAASSKETTFDEELEKARKRVALLESTSRMRGVKIGSVDVDLQLAKVELRALEEAAFQKQKAAR